MTLPNNYSMTVALPKTKTSSLKRCFKYSAPMLWNNLSLEAKPATSLRQFISEALRTVSLELGWLSSNNFSLFLVVLGVD